MARRRAVRQRQTRANEGEQPKNEEAPSASIDPDGASELAGNGNGEGEIRTPATLAGRPVFETGAFNRSATSPCGSHPPYAAGRRTQLKPGSAGHAGRGSLSPAGG